MKANLSVLHNVLRFHLVFASFPIFPTVSLASFLLFICKAIFPHALYFRDLHHLILSLWMPCVRVFLAMGAQWSTLPQVLSVPMALIPHSQRRVFIPLPHLIEVILPCINHSVGLRPLQAQNTTLSPPAYQSSNAQSISFASFTSY